MKKRLSDLAFLLSHAWKNCKQCYFSVILKSLFEASLPLFDIAGLGIVVDALTKGESREAITKLIVIFLSCNLFVLLLSQLFTLINNNIMRKSSDIVQLGYMYDAVRINYHYAEDKSILDQKKRSVGGNSVWFLSHFGDLFKYVVQFAGIFYLFSLLSPVFIVIILLTSTVSVLLSFKSEKLSFALSEDCVEDERKLEYLYMAMTDYGFAKEVRVNRAGHFLALKYDACMKELAQKLAKHTKQTNGIDITTVVITAVQSAAMYAYFSYQVYSSQITIAEYTVLLGATTLFISLFLGFWKKIAQIRTTLDYTDLFRDYCNNVKTNSTISSSNELPIPDISFDDLTLSFENVSFSYPNNERVVLKDISFTLKQGERMGLVGLNGSGKTTLIKLMCRLYDPCEGRITLNGIDIRTIPYKEYTKYLGIVLQDFCLFAYSVRENIVFDRAENRNKLNDAIQKSGLADKIASMKNGVETFITKRFDNEGIDFSGGEGQKLALARVLYKNAGLLMLDEPTSALDPIAEYELFSRLDGLSEGKATLFISHRLSSTKFCDRILVLQDGSIIEEGTHSELMKKGGVYQKLFSTQSKYYERQVAAYEKIT